MYAIRSYYGEPAIEGLKKAKEKGLKTIVNMQVNLATMTGLGVGKDAILEALQYIDVFAPCREGLFDICETDDIDAAKDYLRPYFKNIVITSYSIHYTKLYEVCGCLGQ